MSVKCKEFFFFYNNSVQSPRVTQSRELESKGHSYRIAELHSISDACTLLKIFIRHKIHGAIPVHSKTSSNNGNE